MTSTQGHRAGIRAFGIFTFWQLMSQTRRQWQNLCNLPLQEYGHNFQKVYFLKPLIAKPHADWW